MKLTKVQLKKLKDQALAGHKIIKNLDQFTKQQVSYMLTSLSEAGFDVRYHNPSQWSAMFFFIKSPDRYDEREVSIVFGDFVYDKVELGYWAFGEGDTTNVVFTTDLDDNVRKVLDYRDYFAKNILGLKIADEEAWQQKLASDHLNDPVIGASVDVNETVKITRRQLRKLIQEVYKPGMEKTMHRAKVMDPKMLKSLSDIEISGIEGMAQAQDLALAMGSEEKETSFLDAETYSQIEHQNKQWRRNAKMLRRLLTYFEKMITSLGMTSNSMGPPLYGRIPGVKGNPVTASSITTGLADPKAYRENLVGGDHAYAEIKLSIEGIPGAEVVVRVEDNMYAYDRDVTISLTHEPNWVPSDLSMWRTNSINFRDNRETMKKARDLDHSVRKIISKEIIAKAVK